MTLFEEPYRTFFIESLELVKTVAQGRTPAHSLLGIYVLLEHVTSLHLNIAMAAFAFQQPGWVAV